MPESAAQPLSPGRLRADKWLWHARVVKTRTLAASLIKAGKVRVNSDRIAQPSKTVVPGDVLTITLERQIKVLRVVALGARRGPASEAQGLYEDLSPPVEKTDVPGQPARQGLREEGAGRPTKKERRDLNRFRSDIGEDF